MGSQEYPNRHLLRAAANAPYLERNEEFELATRWNENRDQEALHRLTSAHMRLVLALAFKFKRYGLSMSDMIQEGHIGLLEAAARFEPERGVRFSTYATWWIRASIQDYILRNWSIVRGGTSSGQKALFFNLRRLRAEIEKNGKPGGRHEIYRQLALAIGVQVADVEAMDARFSGPDISLNAPVGQEEESGSERQDLIASDEALPDENVGNIIDGERRLEWLAEALNVLNDREREIIESRRLADSAATLEELGGRLGISKERVRQIEARAMEKLKGALLQINPDFETFVRA